PPSRKRSIPPCLRIYQRWILVGGPSLPILECPTCSSRISVRPSKLASNRFNGMWVLRSSHRYHLSACARTRKTHHSTFHFIQYPSASGAREDTSDESICPTILLSKTPYASWASSFPF